MALRETDERLDWQEDAACRPHGNELFFGADEEGESELDRQQREARAKSICASCPVKEPCLEYAIETAQRYGIWGGTNDKERSALKRRRARSIRRL